MPDADSGWYLVIPLVIAGAGLGLLVSQLNNYTLAPIDDERISEAAGVNSAAGSFGLSFGLAVAGGVLLATLSLAFTNMTNASPVIPSAQQQQIAQTLEDDAQVVSNTQLDKLLADEPPAVRDEILSINTDATNLALQVALLVPILAGLLGLFDSFRMMRLPDIEPSASVEAAALAWTREELRENPSLLRFGAHRGTRRDEIPPSPFRGARLARKRGATRATHASTPMTPPGDAHPERRGWDSNPRGGLTPPTRFPVALLKPLGHLSRRAAG